MTSELLSDILTKHGPCSREGNAITIPGGLKATIYAALADESLIVDRVASITLDPQVVIVQTSRCERFFFIYEDVRAVRFDES